ncbi:hypothetical protein [Acidipropionibacterium virtanenii]|uniref:hypothetical protein n=1 Tax=Acidipropionibacterium virtanenii TaxID=2057246 RepID=UPI0011BEF6EF|nr:hypothetical protein [Acidipropionibacterium virtanenii]
MTSNDAEDFNADDAHYNVYTPDDFFELIGQSDPHCVGIVTGEQLSYWKSQPKHIQLDDALIKSGRPSFARTVREALKVLSRDGYGL